MYPYSTVIELLVVRRSGEAESDEQQGTIEYVNAEPKALAGVP